MSANKNLALGDFKLCLVVPTKSDIATFYDNIVLL